VETEEMIDSMQSKLQSLEQENSMLKNKVSNVCGYLGFLQNINDFAKACDTCYQIFNYFPLYSQTLPDHCFTSAAS